MINRVTDLTFLKNFAKDDRAVYEKFIRIFLTDSASLMKELHQKIADADWDRIETISHTLRSQFNFMGIKEGEELLRWIKEHSIAHQDLAGIQEKMKLLTSVFLRATNELQEELNFLKNSLIEF